MVESGQIPDQGRCHLPPFAAAASPTAGHSTEPCTQSQRAVSGKRWSPSGPSRSSHGSDSRLARIRDPPDRRPPQASFRRSSPYISQRPAERTSGEEARCGHRNDTLGRGTHPTFPLNPRAQFGYDPMRDTKQAGPKQAGRSKRTGMRNREDRAQSDPFPRPPEAPMFHVKHVVSEPETHHFSDHQTGFAIQYGVPRSPSLPLPVDFERRARQARPEVASSAKVLAESESGARTSSQWQPILEPCLRRDPTFLPCS